MPNSKKILIVAGEASGDLYASQLISEINKLAPGIKFFGLGGVKMQQQGAELCFKMTDLAVVGLFEVLKNLKKFQQIFRNLLQTVDREDPGLAVLVDYPGFNLRLARELKKRNIPVIYYISPQVWAWGRKRIKTIKQLVKRMIVFFKFEEELYKKEGIPVSFIGHPLLDGVKASMTKKELFDRLNIPDNKYTVALLPGSREKEVKNILPRMLDTAGLICKELSSVTFLILRSSTVREELFNSVINGRGLPAYILHDMTYEGLACSDFAMVASGTATLETALLGVPMAILYKVSFLSWLYLRTAIKIPHIGMVNIVAGERIVPEFLQYHIQPGKIASYIKEILTNQRESDRIKTLLGRVKKNLGESRATEKAARIILKEL